MNPRESRVLKQVRIEAAHLPNDHVHGGGPVHASSDIPDWVYQVRDGQVVGRPPATTRAADLLPGSFVWGGWAGDHPGHFMAEHVPRLLFASQEHPGSKWIFIRRSNPSHAAVPGWFWDILGWFDIEPDQVTFVHDAPVTVEELLVYPQAEHVRFALDETREGLESLAGVPNTAYLTALNDLFASKGLEPWTNDVVYLSRAGLPGHFGGELYLEQELTQQGVLVIRPEQLSISDQLRLYAGAKKLIFAEGSALHFRQLLGYVDQDVLVLQRRPFRPTAIKQLQPRVNALVYKPVVYGVVQGPYNPKYHIPQEDKGFPYTDCDRLLSAFQWAGVDLSTHWNSVEAEDQVLEELKQWAQGVRDIPELSPVKCAYNAEISLMAMGAISLAPTIGKIIDPTRAYGFFQDIRPHQAYARRLEDRISQDSLAAHRANSPAVRALLTIDAKVLRSVRSLRRAAVSVVKRGGLVLAPKLPAGLRTKLNALYSRLAK